MLSSTNFRHTLRFAIRYHALATPFAKLAFQETDDRGIITIEPAPYPTIDGDLYRYIVELQWGNATSLLRDVMGPSFGPLAVHAAFDGRASPSDYPAVVGCPVLFGQEENRFIFDAGWLDRPAEFGNRVTYAMVVKMCDDLLAELELREGWAGKVRRCLMASLPALNSFEDIANELDISPRSLRRRLSEENASYRKLPKRSERKWRSSTCGKLISARTKSPPLSGSTKPPTSATLSVVGPRPRRPNSETCAGLVHAPRPRPTASASRLVVADGRATASAAVSAAATRSSDRHTRDCPRRRTPGSCSRAGACSPRSRSTGRSGRSGR